jgi:hypothetical protein
MTINKTLFHEICEYLGSDLDSSPCKQIRDHMEAYPNCEVYVNKIKQTIEIYRQADQCDQVPEKVTRDLLTCLKLNDPSKTCDE